MNKEKYSEDIQKLIDRAMEEQRNLNHDALETLLELKEKAEELGDEGLLGFSYYYIANTYYTLDQNYQKYRSYLGLAIKYLLLANDKELLTRAYNFVGVDAINNGSYDISYYYYMMALNTCEDLGSTYLLSIVNSNIGQLYARLGNYEKAREYIRKGHIGENANKGDLYYYHNLMNEKVMDGTVSIKMGDIESAKESSKEIEEMEKELIGTEGINEVLLAALFFRTQVAFLTGEREEYEKLMEQVLANLKEFHLIFDSIDDIYDFCIFFIENGETKPIRRILDDLSDSVEASGVNHMKRLFGDIEIMYLEKTGDEEGASKLLRQQHRLAEIHRQEQNQLYMYSMQLIDTMTELRRERERMLEENAKLQHQAMTDALTDMPNRMALDYKIDEIFKRATEEGKQVCVEMLDIDFFKSYNDNYGHTMGDKCLRSIARVIMEVSEDEGIFCARYGGDEFVIIYEDMSESRIIARARELERKVRNLRIENLNTEKDSDSMHITISQGLCIGVPGEGKKPGDFLVAADEALYDVKRGNQGISQSVCMKRK